MKGLFVVLIATIVSLMVSCAMTENTDSRQKHANVYTTMKVIEESDIGPDDVIRMVDTFRDALKVGATYEGLQENMISALGYDRLSPSDQYLALVLVESWFSEDMTGEVGREVTEENLVWLEEWISWVEQAAYMSGEE